MKLDLKLLNLLVALLTPAACFAQAHDCPQHAQPMQQTQHAQASASSRTQAGHHAYLKLEREAIENGQGFGMALAADRNGYPGPKHILELQAVLKLSPEQEAAVTQLMAAMKEKALARGRDILAAEQRLEEMFRSGRPEAELREETYRIATLRAQLRWVHLETHVAARKLLSEEQLGVYHHTRHGGSAHAH